MGSGCKIAAVCAVIGFAGSVLAQGPSGPPAGFGAPPTSRSGYSPAPYGMQPGIYRSPMGNPVPSTRFGPGPGEMGRPSMVPPSPQSSVYSPMPSTRSEAIPDGVVRRGPSTQPDLPVQDRLKLPLINYQRKQGIDNIDRGRDAQDEFKVKMGIQQVNEANERLGRIETEPTRSSSPDRGDRGNSHSKGRGNR